MTVQLVNPGLIRRVREGEPSAIAELYERFGTMVYRTAFNIMRNRADADDVHQNVFVGISTAIASYEARGSFEGWLLSKPNESRSVLKILLKTDGTLGYNGNTGQAPLEHLLAETGYTVSLQAEEGLSYTALIPHLERLQAAGARTIFFLP